LISESSFINIQSLNRHSGVGEEAFRLLSNKWQK
jgi:hypothetical protein